MPRSLRAFSLRPLKGKRNPRLTRRRVVDAARVIFAILQSDGSLRAQRDAMAAARAEAGESAGKDAEVARRDVELARALFRARRFSWTEYVFYASVWCEGVHDGRHMDGVYAPVLAPLSRAIEVAEQAKPFDEAICASLNREYDRVIDEAFGDVCIELGAADIAELWRARRAEYDELRERGRRFVHHSDEYDRALRDLVAETSASAERSAAGGEFRAAVTLLGASLEGLLLQRCRRSARQARRVAAGLPRRMRNRAASPIEKWSFEILIEVCDRAGWLPTITSEAGALSPAGMAHSVREMRNWIHPGRESRDRPWKGVFGPDYQVAHALFTLVATALRPPRSIHRARMRL